MRITHEFDPQELPMSLTNSNYPRELLTSFTYEFEPQESHSQIALKILLPRQLVLNYCLTIAYNKFTIPLVYLCSRFKSLVEK